MTEKDVQIETSTAGDGSAATHPELRHEVQEIDLHEPLVRLWNARRTLLRVVGLFVLAGVLFVLGSRREFQAGATLMPEKQQDGGLSAGAGLGLLQQFGGMLGGIDPSSMLSKGSALPVQIYPDILHSTPVLLALLEHPVYVGASDSMVTLYTYLDRLKPFSLWDEPVDFVAQLPGRAKGWLMDEEVVPAGRELPLRLTTRQEDILKDLRKRVTASIDKKTGVLSVGVRMPNPYVAAQVADAAVGQMTDYITQYRLKKLQQDLSFMEERHGEARSRYNGTWQELARFRDRNQHLARDVARTEEQRLQAEYDLALTVYNSLATKLEEARIRVQEETPVFQVLQPVTVPLRKSSPQTVLVLILCGLVGVAAGGGWVLYRGGWG